MRPDHVASEPSLTAALILIVRRRDTTAGSQALYTLAVALLAGEVIINTINEELPAEKRGRILSFPVALWSTACI